jgi:hypothetical protein
VGVAVGGGAIIAGVEPEGLEAPAPERFPRDPSPRFRHSAEAAESLGRAGQGPTPPSSTAAPSHTPPRRCLRGVQGHYRLAHEWSHRYACLRSGRRTGQCSHAQKDAARLDCPRLALSCQATASGPPSARQRARTDAAPCLTSSPPEGHSGQHRLRCTLPMS